MTYRWHGIDASTGFDYDADRLKDTIERLQESEEECADAVKALRDESRDVIDELFSGAYSSEHYADVGRQLGQLADAYWRKRGLQEIDQQDEDAALSRAGL